MNFDFLAPFFPSGLLDHFTPFDFKELGDIRYKTMFYEIHLEEDNVLLGGYDQSLYESKGFTEISLQDFPIRGRAVMLIIRRRRWRLKSDKSKIVNNNFSHIAAGSGFTNELSAFLKDSD